jgi:hypothetical protein
MSHRTQTGNSIRCYDDAAVYWDHAEKQWHAIWAPGLPASLVHCHNPTKPSTSATLSSLSTSGAFLPSIGATIAAFSSALADLVNSLAQVHQVQASHERRELRLATLECVAVDLRCFLLEEENHELVRAM